jgi:hypothetical protein
VLEPVACVSKSRQANGQARKAIALSVLGLGASVLKPSCPCPCGLSAASVEKLVSICDAKAYEQMSKARTVGAFERLVRLGDSPASAKALPAESRMASAC